jgi:hypothetical protein
MSTNEMLIDLFRRFEDAKAPVQVSFRDGSLYDLRILSTMHAEEGGDVVADVLRSIRSSHPERWNGAAMNFRLDSVVRVQTDNECLFTRLDG